MKEDDNGFTNIYHLLSLSFLYLRGDWSTMFWAYLYANLSIIYDIFYHMAMTKYCSNLLNMISCIFIDKIIIEITKKSL